MQLQPKSESEKDKEKSSQQVSRNGKEGWEYVFQPSQTAVTTSIYFIADQPST